MRDIVRLRQGINQTSADGGACGPGAAAEVPSPSDIFDGSKPKHTGDRGRKESSGARQDDSEQKGAARRNVTHCNLKGASLTAAPPRCPDEAAWGAGGGDSDPRLVPAQPLWRQQSIAGQPPCSPGSTSESSRRPPGQRCPASRPTLNEWALTLAGRHRTTDRERRRISNRVVRGGGRGLRGHVRVHAGRITGTRGPGRCGGVEGRGTVVAGV
jgi:hypothetical protein